MSTLSDFGSTQECTDCAGLPDGFPCSDCYIKRGVGFDE